MTEKVGEPQDPWEVIWAAQGERVLRMDVPGGWIYRVGTYPNSVSVVFVPAPGIGGPQRDR